MTSSGTIRCVRLVGSSSAILAAGPTVEALAGGPPPGDRVDPRPERRLAGPEARDRRLAVPVPADRDRRAVLPDGARRSSSASRSSRSSAPRASRGRPIRRFSPHFFVLGIAFLLLETKSLVSFSLLFGTTWLVNALAFFAILASVLLAIAVNVRLQAEEPGADVRRACSRPSRSPTWCRPTPCSSTRRRLRYALAAAIAFAPVFFANLVFTHSFRDTASADMAFASNLLGAMVGGALEYLALLTGFRSLLLLVAGLYVLAFLFSQRWRFLADKDLVLGEAAGSGPDWPTGRTRESRR